MVLNRILLVLVKSFALFWYPAEMFVHSMNSLTVHVYTPHNRKLKKKSRTSFHALRSIWTICCSQIKMSHERLHFIRCLRDWHVFFSPSTAAFSYMMIIQWGKTTSIFVELKCLDYFHPKPSVASIFPGSIWNSTHFMNIKTVNKTPFEVLKHTSLPHISYCGN